MDKLLIKGGAVLRGTIPISGAKNAALPLIAASLLTEQPVILKNVPDVKDIDTLITLLKEMGVSAEKESFDAFNNTLILQAKPPIETKAPYDLVRQMRASILVLGPLIARWGEGKISLPGGCAIGIRPIDLHLDGLKALGATIELEHGYVHAKAPNGLKGTTYVFPIVSVTGTENLLMAATLAKGETRLQNVAREPEIADLAHLLNKMGAKITGIGTGELVIQGVSSLEGASHHVMSDRIELGTYMIAAAITGGDVRFTHASLDHLSALVHVLRQAGVEVDETEAGICVRRQGALRPVDITTAPYPGFATDLQAQTVALLSLATGTSTITETIWENRFMHVAELDRMGANIDIHGSTVVVKGVPQLMGAEVMATDLRASVALILAGLVAKGETLVHRVYHLDRGYSHLEQKLGACGAELTRVSNE